jgi:hypothetical protein
LSTGSLTRPSEREKPPNEMMGSSGRHTVMGDRALSAMVNTQKVKERPRSGEM